MVTIKKSTIAIILVVIVAIFLYFQFTAGSIKYPNINTPKPTWGNPEAKVKIIEFGDIQCPACKVANPIITQIKEEYKNNISFQFYHLPLRNIHQYAQKAAEAAECANDQGKMFEYIDAAYDTYSPELSNTNLNKIANDIKLDTANFTACLDSGTKSDAVNSDYSLAMSKNLRGTPTFFINGKELQFNNFQELETKFKEAIEEELKK